MARSTEVKARMVSASEDLISHRGYGVTMLDIIERADAPRGSIYHHFPNGKQELASEVARKVEQEIQGLVEYMAAKVADPAQFLIRLVGHHRKRLVNSDYELGCPLTGIVTGGEIETEELGAAIGATYTTWQNAIANALISKGLPPVESAQLASTTVAGIEGCIIVARATWSPQPFEDFLRWIPVMVESALYADTA
jgi:AcrR family transcriptional regulator